MLRDERENVQSAREALLASYSSKSAAHGTYILTLVIAIFTFSQVFPPTAIESRSQILVPSGILSFLMVLIFQMAIRAHYWGGMTATIIGIKPLDDSEIVRDMIIAVRDKKAKATVLYRLEDACARSMKETNVGFLAHRWLWRPVVWLVLLAVFCTCFILVFNLYAFLASV